MAKQLIVPERAGSLAELRRLPGGCRNCPLWEHATRSVFGLGPDDAEMVIVGEQPGNQEDLAGKPFVGPAGKLLDRALEEAGIDRSNVWVTNAVKHFQWKPAGKIRLHQKPSVGEINACKPWLQAELSKLAPKVLILLGATASRSLLGPAWSVTKHRGLIKDSDLANQVVLTVHPSYLLRLRVPAEKQNEYARFVSDLKLAIPG